MTVVILVEGLSAQEDPPLHQLSPALADLAARGRNGTLAWPQEEIDSTLEGPGLFALFGVPQSPSAGQDLPTGHLLARYSGLADDPQLGWACLGFTHLHQVGTELRFVSPQRTGQSREEVAALAQLLATEYPLDGWQVHAKREDFLLLSTTHPARVKTTPLAHLDGRTALEVWPKGPDAPSLIKLLTSGQMLLSRHPLNRDRLAQGRLPLNTPWIWGVGRDDDVINPALPVKGVCWSAEPMLAGLAHNDGWEPTLFADNDDTLPTGLLADILTRIEQKRRAMVHVRLPALLARHGLAARRAEYLRRLDDQLWTPLATALQAGSTQLVILAGPLLTRSGEITSGSSPWVVISGEGSSRWSRFWQTHPWGKGETLSMADFRREWMI
ncbi:MAG: hypothetical protein HQL64_02610 [Magnetococcales bacterium]|nr:hypothetical protein [Magnetococcales bacterium]